MRPAALVGALLLSALVSTGCSQTKFVTVCSEHGGVKSITAPDHLDDYYTRDVLCNDGITQRPEQAEDQNGKDIFLVPSEHNP